MPKVSAAHLEARRRQVLAAARACFARDGFHRATMHDVVREAGLSAGAVYRYFAGKEALIEALALERHRREREVLARAAQEAGFERALRALTRAFIGALAEPGERADRRLGVQLWAEALREPRLLRIVRAGALEPRRRIAALLRRAKRRGELQKQLDVEATARLAIALFHGIVLQQAWEPGLDVARLARALDAAATLLLRADNARALPRPRAPRRRGSAGRA